MNDTLNRGLSTSVSRNKNQSILLSKQSAGRGGEKVEEFPSSKPQEFLRSLRYENLPVKIV